MLHQGGKPGRSEVERHNSGGSFSLRPYRLSPGNPRGFLIPGLFSKRSGTRGERGRGDPKGAPEEEAELNVGAKRNGLGREQEGNRRKC